MSGKIHIALGLAATGLLLSGCTGFGKALGGGKNPPDEFAITTKAPLVLPPDYALQPPKPGESRPQEKSPSERAQQLLVGDTSATPPSPGELLLIQSAGALDADTNIRAVLASENGGQISKDANFANRVIFWRTDAEGNLNTEQAPLQVEDVDAWMEGRKESIENATGTENVVINKSEKVLKLPGIK